MPTSSCTVADQQAAAQMLTDLAGRGFLAPDGTSFRYAPDDTSRRLLDRVADLYATRRVTIIRLIFAAPASSAAPEPPSGLRAFSDAFRLRPGSRKEWALWPAGTDRAAWREVPQTLQTDLSILLRLVVALVLGAAIGWERESAGKAAGLRTHMLVAVASALFVALGDAMVEHFLAQAQRLGRSDDDVYRSDPIRIIEAVVTGISFLGAGTIFVSHGRERIFGLTTAAAIWATAAVGIAVGLERYLLGAGTTALILVVLRLIPFLGIERDQRDSGPGDSATP